MNERIQEQDAMERALSELVDKICPGLDTGDLLADAATASKSIDIPPAAQPAPVQDEQQAFIDSLPKDSDDKMFTQIDHWARESYKRHKFSVRGQAITAADSYDSHLIWATLRWAKENTQPAAQPAQEPVLWGVLFLNGKFSPYAHRSKEDAERIAAVSLVGTVAAPLFAAQQQPAQPEQKPVAWISAVTGDVTMQDMSHTVSWAPLYTTPPAAQPAQEPVAIVDAQDDGYWADILPDRNVKVGQFLYATPPAAQRQWTPMSKKLLCSQVEWLYKQMWIALKDGSVMTGVYEWRQGLYPDRLLLDGTGHIWAYEAEYVMPVVQPERPSKHKENT